MAKMDIWEYKFLVGSGIRCHLKDSAGRDFGPLCEELLNRLGQEGWEVCSHVFSTGSQPSLIVKRIKRPPTETS